MSTLQDQGLLADKKLTDQGLVLTQGGEPTFVPQDTAAPEWNFAALGPQKLFYARKLARALASGFYKGAVVSQSFSKQYPGEPLPRWSIGVWREKDGAPLWKKLDRLRLDQQEVLKATHEHAALFVEKLTAKLGLPSTVLTVCEDLMAQPGASSRLRHYSHTKGDFAGQVSVDELKAAYPSCFEPVGWVLPLDYVDGVWHTEAWEVDPDRFVLVPGDSPVGLRLPLGQLPEKALRRAMTVEAKNDELVVFLPPLPSFQAFAELVRLIEALAAEFSLPPIGLEGYAPPGDPEREGISFMSDPGVVEVNLPPAADWGEFERVLRGLYAAAEQAGLHGYKYQLSGRKIGTGGGAHILFGGPTPLQSPFFQRPTILSSWLRFGQHHPCLSRVFTGLFTGPSSQAPRVDESVHEAPYELEITLQAMENMPIPGDPYLQDALLRNLLLDWNGNTHRAELSVDKLFNQNSPNGCLGLIEFRAFEMLPTVEMLLAPNCLLRALAAVFAEEAFTQPLVSWGPALADRFSLPWFLRKDLHDVLDYLNAHGFSFQPEWFEPHIDFRYPVITRFEVGGACWTLRHAVEPWPVMGDHTGTGRVVDATTERLELLVEDMPEDTALVAVVNGWEMPLQKVATGTAVGGVRYRLFTNAWGLQPQVKAHSPLRFQIVARDTKNVLHAFDFLNWKRGSGGYPGLPESAADAAARVDERLVAQPDRVGQKTEWKTPPEHPATQYHIDLRRF